MVAITWTAPANDNSYTSNHGTVTATYANNQLSMTVQLDANNSISKTWTINNGNALAVPEVSVDLNVRDVTQPAGPGTNPTPPGPNPYPDDPNSPFKPDYVIPDDVVRIHFGPGADSREDFYDIKKYDATIKGLGLEGVRIETQNAAQKALVQINDAIIAKDKIRADYGAMQNRLENTASVQTIQAENLQNSESRISDVNVATEMTNFVRNQILTQSSVAMLAQANSFPQMAMVWCSKD